MMTMTLQSFCILWKHYLQKIVQQVRIHLITFGSDSNQIFIPHLSSKDTVIICLCFRGTGVWCTQRLGSSEKFSIRQLFGKFSIRQLFGKFSIQQLCGKFSFQQLCGKFSIRQLYGKFSIRQLYGKFSIRQLWGKFSFRCGVSWSVNSF